VEEFKDAIFVFEAASLPPELQVVQGIADKFKTTPEGATTLVQICRTMDEAAITLDDFKAKTCGSAYSLAVINLNAFPSLAELKFLMSPPVVGDPQTVFVASLKYMNGDLTAFAREKVQRESEQGGRTPSCVDSYSAANLEETHGRISELLCAYLREAEERAKAKRSGTAFFGSSAAEELLRKSGTAFYGRKFKSVRGTHPGV
jgi:hypothetical protein